MEKQEQMAKFEAHLAQTEVFCTQWKRSATWAVHEYKKLKNFENDIILIEVDAYCFTDN